MTALLNFVAWLASCVEESRRTWAIPASYCDGAIIRFDGENLLITGTASWLGS